MHGRCCATWKIVEHEFRIQLEDEADILEGTPNNDMVSEIRGHVFKGKEKAISEAHWEDSEWKSRVGTEHNGSVLAVVGGGFLVEISRGPRVVPGPWIPNSIRTLKQGDRVRVRIETIDNRQAKLRVLRTI